jgi:hypothetical protein
MLDFLRSHSGDYHEYCLLGGMAVQSGRSPPMFRDSVRPQSSVSKSKQRKKPTRIKRQTQRIIYFYLPTASSWFLFCLLLNLTMEAICSSETSIGSYRTRCRIPEDNALHILGAFQISAYVLKAADSAFSVRCQQC